jgi:hypothetical protein
VPAGSTSSKSAAPRTPRRASCQPRCSRPPTLERGSRRTGRCQALMRRRSSLSRALKGVGGIPSRFRGGSSMASTRDSRSESASGAANGWIATLSAPWVARVTRLAPSRALKLHHPFDRSSLHRFVSDDVGHPERLASRLRCFRTATLRRVNTRAVSHLTDETRGGAVLWLARRNPRLICRSPASGMTATPDQERFTDERSLPKRGRSRGGPRGSILASRSMPFELRGGHAAEGSGPQQT